MDKDSNFVVITENLRRSSRYAAASREPAIMRVLSSWHDDKVGPKGLKLCSQNSNVNDYVDEVQLFWYIRFDIKNWIYKDCLTIRCYQRDS